MSNITSAYNFVSLNKEIFIPEWGKYVSQDIPFSDGEDGQIMVRLKAVSPLITANAKIDKDNQKEVLVFSHIDFHGEKKYFIPGTSLKGMLRSVMEILSFAEMDMVDDAHFGYRSFGDNKDPLKSKYAKIVDVNKPIQGGWLKSKVDANGIEKLVLYPCSRVDKVLRAEVFKTLGYTQEKALKDAGQSIYKKQEVLSGNCEDKFYPYVFGNSRGRLVVTGDMSGKTHEYLFVGEACETKGIEITEEVKNKFYSIHKSNKDYETWLNYLRKEKKMAVFYLGNETKVSHIGWSRMMRVAFEGGIKDRMKQTKAEEHKYGYSLPELIFGTTPNKAEKGKKESLKGRAQVGHAFAVSTSATNELKEVSVTLGSPKASFYPFYLLQETNTPVNYDNKDASIAGRKRYRVHKNFNPSHESGSDNVSTKLKALDAGCEFELTINIHNMRPVEIGALLSALTLHNQKNVYHNLGMAKSLGYGKVVLTSLSLDGLGQDVVTYISEFEKCMNKFLTGNKKELFVNQKPIKQLMAIASEHSTGLKMMELGEFKTAKTAKTFQPLSEIDFKVVTSIDLEKEKAEHLAKVAKVNEVKTNKLKEILDRGLTEDIIREAICFHKSLEVDEFLKQETIDGLKKYIVNFILENISIEKADRVSLETYSSILTLPEMFESSVLKTLSINVNSKIAEMQKTEDFMASSIVDKISKADRPKTLVNNISNYYKKQQKHISPEDLGHILNRIGEIDFKSLKKAVNKEWSDVKCWRGLSEYSEESQLNEIIALIEQKLEECN